jgi:hypothetical protein
VTGCPYSLKAPISGLLGVHRDIETKFFVIRYCGYYCGLSPIQAGFMTQQTSTLYAKLLGETARITWEELQPFFAKGALLWVDSTLDLIAVAEAMAENQHAQVSAWLEAGTLAKVGEGKAADLLQRAPELWAVVVSPWVVFQERAGA